MPLNTNNKKKTGGMALGRGLGALLGNHRPQPAQTSHSNQPSNIGKNPQKEKTTKSTKTSTSKHSTKAANKNEVAIVKNTVLFLKPAQIKPNANQPRKFFRKESLEELAKSIKEKGILQPILVTKTAENEYQIIAGERRWRAACLAQLAEIPVLVREITDEEIMEQALIENIQREDLNPIEEAQAMQQLMNKKDLTQELLADLLGKSRSSVANTLRLLNISPELQLLVIQDDISAGHARALMSLSNEDEQMKLASTIITEELSVRETEKRVKKFLDSLSTDAEPLDPVTKQYLVSLQNMEDRLKEKWATMIELKERKNKKSGKIVIHYHDFEERERLLKELLK